MVYSTVYTWHVHVHVSHTCRRSKQDQHYTETPSTSAPLTRCVLWDSPGSQDWPHLRTARELVHRTQVAGAWSTAVVDARCGLGQQASEASIGKTSFLLGSGVGLFRADV